MDKYRFTQDEVSAVRKDLGCSEKDAFILVVAPKAKAEKAIAAALDRASLLKKGVLREVRKPNPDGTTSFMRPMPGAARMYPETDVPPICVDAGGIELPELLEQKQMRYQKEFGLSSDLSKAMTRSDLFPLFESSVERFRNIKPAFIAETLVSTPKTLRRKHNVEIDNIKESDFIDIFSRLDSGKLTKGAVEDILISIAKGKPVDYGVYSPLSDEELESEIRSVLKESKGIEFNAVVGRVMGALKGRAEGRKIIEMLKRLA
jgi:glutamyl-tRNA(Gln) amidotransferase subunit E